MPTSKGFNSTAELRRDWEAYRCNPSAFAGVLFPGGGSISGSVLLRVAKPSAPAWRVFVDIMKGHGITFDEWAGGTYNCRRITGGSNWSPHAYGVALDLNPSRNPYGSKLVTDFPRAFIDDVLAVRTKNGRRVFRWGGDWDDDPGSSSSPYDAMHFEITCSPADLATGLEDPMAFTAEEEHELKALVAELKKKKSNAGAIGYMVDIVRADPVARADSARARADQAYGVASGAGDLASKANATAQRALELSSKPGSTGPHSLLDHTEISGVKATGFASLTPFAASLKPDRIVRAAADVDPKVSRPAWVGTAAAVAVWVAGRYFDVDLPVEMTEEALAQVIAAVTAVSGLVGYFTRSRAPKAA